MQPRAWKLGVLLPQSPECQDSRTVTLARSTSGYLAVSTSFHSLDFRRKTFSVKNQTVSKHYPMSLRGNPSTKMENHRLMGTHEPGKGVRGYGGDERAEKLWFNKLQIYVAAVLIGCSPRWVLLDQNSDVGSTVSCGYPGKASGQSLAVWQSLPWQSLALCKLALPG